MKPYISDIMNDGQQMIFLLEVPIIVNGRFDGVVYGGISADFLSDIVVNLSMGSNGVAYVLDNRGNVIGHREASIVEEGSNMIETAKTDPSVADVAAEVRNLASKSDEAAKATKDLIEGSITAVAEGGQVVARVTESLDKTNSISENVTIKVDAVVRAVECQTTAIAQVTEGIDQISSVIQSTSATSEQSAATAQELSDQSLLMNNLVSTFRLS